MIELAYLCGESLGLSVWTQDEAGPFQTIPYGGYSWAPTGEPQRYPHEYVKTGTAKILTLFHPASGEVRVKGVTSCTNAVLHPWLKQEWNEILSNLPPAIVLDPETNRAVWEVWRLGLNNPISLPKDLPPLRALLIWDNLSGHKTVSMVEWLIQNGIMPLYTPLGGSWLNMSESIQRVLKRRALDGQHPKTTAEIVTWFEQVTRAWNRNPTPFEWGGKRSARRARSRKRRHTLGGSGACTRRPIQQSRCTIVKKWQSSCQVTH